MGILSYGISMTTLEEVFLAVNGSSDGKSVNKSHMKGTQDYSIAEEESENIVAKSSCCKSTGALMTKRFHIYKRDKCGLMCELVIPIFLVILGLAFCEVGWLTSSPAFMLETSAYPSPQRMLFNQDNVKESLKPDAQFTP